MTRDAAPAPTMSDRLALRSVGTDRFESVTPPAPGHVFGGLIIGQALRAADLTVPEGRLPHSLHASFVVAGRGGVPLEYDVERTRDGASFSTRRVVAHQGGDPVLVLTADHQADEEGADYAEPGVDGIPGPDQCGRGRYVTPWFDARDVPAGAVTGGRPHARWSWFRARAPLPADEPALHLESLAYISDHGATRAARQPHAHLSDDRSRRSVSLDHSVWFHRPVDLNDWLLSEMAPVATGRGRGLGLGSIRTSAGVLVATVAQEVMLRSR